LLSRQHYLLVFSFISDAATRIGPGSSEVDILVVPDEIVTMRLIARRGGWAETLAVEGIVRPAIRKLLAKASADLEPQIRRHGDVPLVEQSVEICA
jgi:hypothetical protein